MKKQQLPAGPLETTEQLATKEDIMSLHRRVDSLIEAMVELMDGLKSHTAGVHFLVELLQKEHLKTEPKND